MPRSLRLFSLALAAALTAGCTGAGLAELAPVLAAASGTRQDGGPGGHEAGTGRAEPTGNTTRPEPAGDAGEGEATAPSFIAFKARVEAAAGDPRLTAKLFVEAMIRHEQDADLSRAMASLVVVEADLIDAPESPSGKDFTPGRRYIYDQLAPRPYLLREYLDDAARIGEADLTAHIMIDDDYQAIGKGVDEEAGTAKFFIKVFNDKGTRPRPISLARRDGRWRVSEYSSLFVGT